MRSAVPFKMITFQLANECSFLIVYFVIFETAESVSIPYYVLADIVAVVF